MERFENPKAEEARLRALYRDRVMRQPWKLRLPLNAMKALIGPDCAFRLYSRDPDERERNVSLHNKDKVLIRGG